MKHVRLATMALLIAFCSSLFAAGTDGLVGKWQITDVKVNPKTNERCYFCDLYEHKGYLEFKADGHVTYDGSPEAKEVFYFTNGNVLVFTLDQNATLKSEGISGSSSPMTDTSIAFEYTLNGNTLTITKKFDGYTETYTLTK